MPDLWSMTASERRRVAQVESERYQTSVRSVESLTSGLYFYWTDQHGVEHCVGDDRAWRILHAASFRPGA